ncbi:hypothetical protein C1I97_06060 [Streptomyces sp. NTH33]|uniref:hypothetical protein n=1 Tax=Streptomyces sp. NTH33 TaxID=1735453 RepID=UPI000DA86E7F|nr:hypothetical protein [Streptomyces sp. NTH33]PZH16775.1 hypothetical protein C1I97_06060 [Streptomyces sp. NTH33]
MSGAEAVGPHHRRRPRALVQRHPCRTAAELTALLSAADRSMFAVALRATRESCDIRVDDKGRYWPT